MPDPKSTQKEREALLWQARAQLDLAAIVERYLAQNPPPAMATDHRLYRRWAGELREAGEGDLKALKA